MEKTYTIFTRNDELSQKLASQLHTLFDCCNHSWKETTAGDIIIAIGGDGTFIQAVRQMSFSKDKIFVGVHTGTLGFLQNVSSNELGKLIHALNSETISARKIFIPEISVNLITGESLKFFALNEVLIAGKDHSQIVFSEYVNSEHLQDVHANGICIASSTGDTAYSMNAGGSIDFSNNFQLVRTLDVPIRNASYKRFLPNPIICSEFSVELNPSNNIQIIIDGKLENINSSFISSVNVSMKDGSNYIQKFQLKTYSKTQVIRDKILGYGN